MSIFDTQAMPLPQQQTSQSGADPISKLGQMLRLDPSQFRSPEEFMDAAWRKAPTDMVGEAIDAISKSMGVKAPWDKQQQAPMPQQNTQPMMFGR